ncbi:MAG: hypothetical protein OXG15_10230, partial [Gammaproteobacteria bacterium]|nr:hypothetical protein [Gammaproteobacteria bacterium]
MAIYGSGGAAATGGVTQAQLNSALALKADLSALTALDTEVDAIGTPIYRDILDGEITPTAARRKSVRIDENGNEYVIEPVQVPSTDASGTWANYSNSNSEGPPNNNPSIRGAIGQFYYNPNWHHWYESFSEAPFVRWGYVQPSRALGSSAVWLGELDTDTDASNAITSHDTTKTYLFYNNTTRTVRQLNNSTYTAPVGLSTQYVWTRIGADEAARITRLENQTLARHNIEIADFQIDNNGSHTASIDISAIRSFLRANSSRGYAVFQVVYTYNASVSGGQARLRMPPNNSIVNTGWFNIPSANDQNRTDSSSSAVASSSLPSDTLEVEFDLRQRANGSNVLFTNIEVRITIGFLPTRDQIFTLMGRNRDDRPAAFYSAYLTNNAITLSHSGAGS